MATTKLSKALKDQIRSRAVQELYGEKVRCAEKDLADAVFSAASAESLASLCALLSQEDALRLLASDWIAKSKTCIIDVRAAEQSTSSYREWIDVQQDIPVKGTQYRPTVSVVLSDTDNPIVQALRKKEQIVAQKNSFDADLYDVLLPIPTVNKLQAFLPQMLKYVPSVVEETSVIPIQKLDRIKSLLQ